jgi:hypothetical protein
MGASPAVISNNAGVIIDSTDFSSDLGQVTLTYNLGEIDTSTFTATGYRQYITTMTDVMLDIVGFYNKVASGLTSKIHTILNAPSAPTAWEVDLPSTSVGSQRYTGSGWAKSMKLDGKVNDACRMSASIRVTGTVVRATISS